MKRMLPTFSTYVKRVLTAVKNSFDYLESSCDGSEKQSDHYFFMCESLLLRLWHIAQRLESCTGEVYVW